MDPRVVLGLSILMSFVAFGLTTRLYILPRLRTLRKDRALVPLIVPNAFRFIGLSFLVPGVVSPSFPSALAVPAAFGDLGTAILAVLATLALTAEASWAISAVWVFNVWGTVDLLTAVISVVASGLDPGVFGAAFYIPTLAVPAYLVLHGLIFWLLLRSSR